MNESKPKQQAADLISECIAELGQLINDMAATDTVADAEAKLCVAINNLHQARFSLPGMTYAQATEILNKNLEELQSMNGNKMPDIDRIIPLVSESSQVMTFMQSRIDNVSNYLAEKD
ncbi:MULTISPECIES: hypothetical protein [Aeromonas]|uniref:Uncharacterized protein n=1 Tax=Aeromonas veronii TaxID=654 RepID=A0A4S5CGY3_AERVE|nr:MULTISPECIES: hypothetical protein [Aeromonas]THJ44930.1 hypothetical protein E8Q35_12120 [Aeromonas veronii]